MHKLKIAFILDVFPVLSETFILNQITGLLDLGHDVDIYSMYKGDSDKVHEEVNQYHLLSRAYYPESSITKSWNSLKILSLVLSSIRNNPASSLRTLNVLRYGKRAIRLKLLPLCFKHFKKNPYDIIHCHFGPNGNLGALLKELGVIKGKLVTTFHGYDIRYGLEHGPRVYEPLRAGGDLFFSISKYNRTQLERLGFESDKIADHPVGINLEKFPLRWKNRNILSRGERIKILTVARLVKEKGVEYGIRGIHELLQCNPNLLVEYNIIGNGILKSRLKKLVKRLGLGGVVRFLGDMEHSGVLKELNEAHIFLLPSIAEALPVALMEAQAAGLPVVSTDVGGVSELVEEGVSGYVVAARNPTAIKSKIEYLIRHPEIWPEMGAYGRKVVEKNHDVKKLNRKLVERYYALLDGRNPSEED